MCRVSNGGLGAGEIGLERGIPGLHLHVLAFTKSSNRFALGREETVWLDFVLLLRSRGKTTGSNLEVREVMNTITGHCDVVRFGSKGRPDAPNPAAVEEDAASNIPNPSSWPKRVR
jgi:hypothetical protein